MFDFNLRFALLGIFLFALKYVMSSNFQVQNSNMSNTKSFTDRISGISKLSMPLHELWMSSH